MQTTAIRTVANSLPQNEVILLTLLISKRYIPYTDLQKNSVIVFFLKAFTAFFALQKNFIVFFLKYKSYGLYLFPSLYEKIHLIN